MKIGGKNVWFTSDTHFAHKNLVSGETEWPDDSRCRDFATVKEMNELIVHNINENVKPQDILFHGGDWSFGGIDKIQEFRSKIRCNTIHLLRGNHDQAGFLKDLLKKNDGMISGHLLMTKKWKEFILTVIV